MYKHFLKRVLDIGISIFALLILSPVFVILFICLSVANKGRAFFLQDRPGLNRKIFKVIKFKTMTDAKDAQGDFLPDGERITRVGKFVRSLSLDELPQLVNVLKGDMSLVGPRPLLVKYLPLYDDIQSRRHEVRPGVTGWAQVNGRNAISWDQKFKFDVYYVEHVSFVMDIRILLLTIKKVLFRSDISSATTATMETFTGNRKS